MRLLELFPLDMDSRRVITSRNWGLTEGSLSQQFVTSDLKSSEQSSGTEGRKLSLNTDTAIAAGLDEEVPNG